jgi:hypothetical protein
LLSDFLNFFIYNFSIALCFGLPQSFSNRTPKQAKQAEESELLALFPFGLILKYSKLSQQSRIRKIVFFECTRVLFFSGSSSRVPLPIICQKFGVAVKQVFAKNQIH